MSRTTARTGSHPAVDSASARTRRDQAKPPQVDSAEPGHERLPNQAVLQALGTGMPLDAGLRAQMEQRFGTSFADVRIHDGEHAHQSATRLRAQAYTLGSDIAFGPRRYAPDEAAGRRLLAHELAHVVQQRRGGTEQPRTGGPLEQEADRAAGEAAGGGPVNVEGASAVSVARQPLPGDQETDAPLAPRSLSGSIAKDEKNLSAEALDREMRLIEDYLDYLPTPQERIDLVSEYKALYQESLARRRKSTPPTPAWMQSRQAHDDLQLAHRAWRVTGEVPQTLFPFAWGEIKLGKAMTRAQRYDLMLELQGKAHPLTADLAEDQRDPELLSKEEFSEEFWKRRDRERDACDDEYFWPKYERQCKREVDYKYGGPAYKAYREEIYRRTYVEYLRVQAGIEGVKSGGPFSLLGRTAGYIYGAATNRDPLKTSEDFATVFSLGDAYVAYRGMKSQWSRMRSYNDTGGHVLTMDTPTSLVQKSTGPSALPTPDLPGQPYGASLTGRAGPSTSTPKPPLPAATPPASVLRLDPPKAQTIAPADTPAPPLTTATAPGVAPPAATTPAASNAAASSAITAPVPAGSGAQAATTPAVSPPVAPPRPSRRSKTAKLAPARQAPTAPTGGKAASAPGAVKQKKAARALPPDIEARLKALDLTDAQRDVLRKQLLRKPAAAKDMLDLVEEHLGPNDVAGQVRAHMAQMQGQLFPERGGDNKFRQSTASDLRALAEQKRPTRKESRKAKVAESERMGVQGGMEQAQREGFTVNRNPTPQQFKEPFGKGMDANGRRGIKRQIFEFKGGTSRLGVSKGVVEMSSKWAGRKIAELEVVGDSKVAKALLEAAKTGNLEGIVYWTRQLKNGEKTSRLQGHQLRDRLGDDHVTDDGVIQFDPQQVLDAYQQHRDTLLKAKEAGNLPGLQNL